VKDDYQWLVGESVERWVPMSKKKKETEEGDAVARAFYDFGIPNEWLASPK
jgi:hypothetical protein